MNMRFQIAVRNILRNPRRTALNILMIVGAISAIVLFHGFGHNLIAKLQQLAIKTQYGHLQMANHKTWKLSPEDSPVDRLMTPTPEMLGKISKLPFVDYVSGRMSFYGLILSGDQSLSANGFAFDPGVESQMRDHLTVIEGHNLDKNSKREILLGSGLQEQLGAKPGDTVTLLGYSYDGSVNAVDTTLIGIVQSGLAEVDNSTFFLPLETAQRLLGTDSVERLIIQLQNDDAVSATKASIDSIAPGGVETKTWFDLASFYRQVVEYYGVQNMIIQWILLLLAMLAITNTIGMSITERTGEIGTTRALGDSRWDIISQFLIEGLTLGVLGAFIGCIVGLILCYVVTALKIPILTPGASIPLPIEIDVLPGAFLNAALLTCGVTVLATLIPAIGASRFKIVDALKRNI